ncbi:MAG TPA: DinB family protein [Pyrinomonadaceae bacterium]|nr:DinB family protein [Pyrinomonadaceae bacterium]
MTPEEREKLIERYADGYAEVQRSLEGFPESGLTSHPIEGKWSACEIVQHLADSEMTSAIRIRKLIAQDRPAIEGYDEAAFAVRLRYNERDIQPALDAFKGARSSTAQLLRTMTEEEWKREGSHPEHASYTAEDWLRIYAEHAHNHASQIRRLRAAIG